MFEEIWSKQKQLMLKFDKIEESHGLLQTVYREGPLFNINNPFAQARARDLAYRTIGELGEATEAFRFEPLEAFDVEMSDVYHFLVELMIFVNMPKDRVFANWCPTEADLTGLFNCAEIAVGKTVNECVDPEEDTIRYAAYDVVEAIILALNQLKMKPWKANHKGKETDVDVFYDLMSKAHYAFIKMCVVSGIGAEDLFESYFEKSEVNNKRIEAGQ